MTLLLIINLCCSLRSRTSTGSLRMSLIAVLGCLLNTSLLTLDIQYSSSCPFLITPSVRNVLLVAKICQEKTFFSSTILAVLRQTVLTSWTCCDASAPCNMALMCSAGIFLVQVFIKVVILWSWATYGACNNIL